MPLHLTLSFKAPYRYLGGFVQHSADRHGVPVCVQQSADRIDVWIKMDDPEALHAFADRLEAELPHSIFMGNVHAEAVETVPDACERFASDPYPIGLCPQCLHALFDPNASAYRDDTWICDHYTDAPRAIHPRVTLTPHAAPDMTLLLCDTQRISELFSVTPNEQRALFSIEKPALKLTVADAQLREELGSGYAWVRAPYSSQTALAALEAREAGIAYLFYRRDAALEMSVVQETLLMIRSRDFDTIEPIEKEKDRCEWRFVSAANETGRARALGAYMSHSHGIRFYLKDGEMTRSLFHFAPFVLGGLLARMETDEVRRKLLRNFSAAYPHRYERLQRIDESDFFGALGVVLGLEQDGFEPLSDLALGFRGNGGLKIDAFLDDKGFDFVPFMGSVMSYVLAGAESVHIAYSIFEALADVTITTLEQLKQRFEIDQYVLLGDLFENSIMTSRILSKFQMADYVFPRTVALDYVPEKS